MNIKYLNFHSFGDVIIAGEGLQILTYARHLWPLSSEDSLSCFTKCDTGHPFIMSSPITRDTRTYCRAFGSGAVTTCFKDLLCRDWVFEHATFLFGDLKKNVTLP